jgi:glycosyltransferase involved in cell wall biosynthesis
MVSVIIPVHNGEHTLGEQLKALAQQQYNGEWEIIVVNNCSTDGTVALVKSFQAQIPHLRLIHASERRGRSYARNTGASIARGEQLLFCDADDVVADGWVAALAQNLQTHQLVTGVTQTEKLNPKEVYWQRPSPPSGDKPILKFLPYANSCNLGIWRDAFEQANGFSETFARGQDIDFSWRVQLLGYPLHVVPEAVVYYRFRQTFRDTWRQTVEYAAAHVLLYRHFAPHGMPGSSWKQIGRRYFWLMRRFRCLFKPASKAKKRWLYLAALSWGRLAGSVRYRRLYL